ncbi:MAG: SIR2 family protein [Candidatus Magasanikbacteria bacterium]|nr:SIR2 family protein [Candidatus Magasanikbacteria bacterium]
MNWINNTSEIGLLTGAGFTANFGGYLQREMWNKMFNHEFTQKNEVIKKKMLKAARGACLSKRDYDYESVYTELFETQPAIIQILMDTYKVLDQSISISHYNETSYNEQKFREFIAEVSRASNQTPMVWFTLNQDLFCENFAQVTPLWIRYTRQDDNNNDKVVELPNELKLQEIQTRHPNGQLVYVKLHGSYGWLSSRGGKAVAVGADKKKFIDQEPLLKSYFDEIFSPWLRQKRKLLVIGYSFRDQHVNDYLIKAIQDENLRLFIISLADMKDLVDSFAKQGDSKKVEMAIDGYWQKKLVDIFTDYAQTSVEVDELRQALTRDWMNKDFFGTQRLPNQNA